MDKPEEKKEKTFWQKYYKVIAVLVLLLAFILLFYTVYRVLPKKQHGGKRNLKVHGGSCGCAAGASADNLPMGYGGTFRI